VDTPVGDRVDAASEHGIIRAERGRRDGSAYGLRRGSIVLSRWRPRKRLRAPKRGGTLTFMIPADARRASTGIRRAPSRCCTRRRLLQHAGPHQSENASSTTDFMCDLCTEIRRPTDDGKTFTFKLRDGVKFHDGTPLTSADVKAAGPSFIRRKGVRAAARAIT